MSSLCLCPEKRNNRLMKSDSAGSGSWKAVLEKAKIPLMVLAAIWVISTLMPNRLLPNGGEAPNWKLALVSDDRGEWLSLDDMRGYVVVLDFWATTCPPCLRQIDEMEKVKRLMEARGVKVVGIALDENDMGSLRGFIDDRKISYPIAVDKGDVAEAYRVRSLPTLYVIDGRGRVAASHSGFWSGTEIARAASEALSSLK